MVTFTKKLRGKADALLHNHALSDYFFGIDYCRFMFGMCNGLCHTEHSNLLKVLLLL